MDQDKKFDAVLHVAARRDKQLWGAMLGTKISKPIRTAGFAKRDPEHLANVHTLLATATISALGTLTRRQYDKLKLNADTPLRLRLTAHHEFLNGIQGTGPLRLGDALRRNLMLMLGAWDVTCVGIDLPRFDHTSTALLNFAERSLAPADFLGPRFFLPDAISVTGTADDNADAHQPATIA